MVTLFAVCFVLGLVFLAASWVLDCAREQGRHHRVIRGRLHAHVIRPEARRAYVTAYVAREEALEADPDLEDFTAMRWRF